MTAATTGGTTNAPAPSEGAEPATVPTADSGLDHWRGLRADGDIQFEPVVIPERPPREPSWFERLLDWLSEKLNLGEVLVEIWPVMQWLLLGLLVLAVLSLLYRLFGDALGLTGRKGEAETEESWTPDRQQSLALLEEAERLASEGRYDEATHLLLQRSVGQIAEARPDWVEPSSTARELAALKELPAAAREAFGVIAERVERSLFALRSLEKSDWEAARGAYERFALDPIAGRAT